MLVACAVCGRQYDASHLATGERLRCECGERIEIVLRVARAPRPRRCGACGGALGVDARACAYCDGEITLEDRGLSEICPVCYARMLTGAKYCMDCGVAIAPQVIAAAAADKRCPRCDGELRSRALGRVNLIECKSCAGLWLEPGVLESLCDQTESACAVLSALAGDGRAPSAPSTRSGPMYLPCIRCDDRMTRKNFGGSSGILIDVCKNHGAWLDHTELERILEFVRGGGLVRAREREAAHALARLEGSQSGGALPMHDVFEDRRESIELGDVLAWVARWLSR
jgi:Zn-finger nucleic acid-binding protein